MHTRKNRVKRISFRITYSIYVLDLEQYIPIYFTCQWPLQVNFKTFFIFAASLLNAYSDQIVQNVRLSSEPLTLPYSTAIHICERLHLSAIIQVILTFRTSLSIMQLQSMPRMRNSKSPVHVDKSLDEGCALPFDLRKKNTAYALAVFSIILCRAGSCI